jgi:hypothetical protein
MSARAARAFGLACVLVASCSEPPPPAQLDGSFIIGDATDAPDGRARDAVVRDAIPIDATGEDDGGQDRRDTSPRDADGIDADALAPDAGPPDPCARTATLTLSSSQVRAMSAAIDGLVVDVIATATLSAAACTRIACSPEAPCCNTCTADILLDDALPLAAGVCATRVGCTGDECNLVCSPPVLGFPQTFRGVVRASPARLELMRVLP